jgi:putative transferase (TIGR04331 family)
MIKSLKIFDKENKRYLITNFHKLNYPKHSKLVFVDEYLFHLYNKEEKLTYNCSYVHSVNDVLKINNSIEDIVKKKLFTYKKKIKYLLNFYHKKSNSEKYWGLITDRFLIILLKSIVQNVKLFENIKLNNFHTIYGVVKEKIFWDTETVEGYIFSNDFRKLLSFFVLKELNNNFVNLKYARVDKGTNTNKIKIYRSILRYIFRLYIFFLKPILIVNGHIGLKNTFNFFLRSYGKIINVPDYLIFNKANNISFLDRNFRKQIKIHENDIVDIIFNKVIGRLFPINYLENFNLIIEDNRKISKKIRVIGTGNCHYYHDHFNILTSEILNNKNGKLVIFQHGGGISKTEDIALEHIDQKYALKKYYFDNPKGLGMHFFNEKKISFEEIKKRNLILILNTATTVDSNHYYHTSRYAKLDPSLVFFSKLKEFNKKKIKLKLFPEKNSLKIKNLWNEKFGNNINFLPIFSNSNKQKFYKAKLVILNDISTPLWELLFIGVPFILICNKNILAAWQYKNSFKKKIIQLNKINVLFNDPLKAADFVNSLDKDHSIDEWWKKISQTKIFMDFKNFLIVERPNYLQRIVKDLKNLNK